MAEADDLIEVELTDAEREVLNRGLVEWSGPARCTEAMARAMGFESVQNLNEQSDCLAGDLGARRPLSGRDWTRTLLATELVFASDVVGSGSEWPDTTGLDDVETLRLLRAIRRKLAPIIVRDGTWARGTAP
jgi:hypothetical protein